MHSGSQFLAQLFKRKLAFNHVIWIFNTPEKGYWRRCGTEKIITTTRSEINLVLSVTSTLLSAKALKIRKSWTLSQTTNFRCFQTERVCRLQFQIQWKWYKVIQMGRKYCGKRRNSTFPEFFQRTYTADTWKAGLVSEEVNLSACSETLKFFRVTHFFCNNSNCPSQ